ncbi:Predicted ATPase [Raoultella planticola]|uniref:Predicted ATPase n=1 Tax=Raoultella planticola TaxID=575 RepID=A0A485A4P7_RAOPL|nr:Predicted ATPase [Raoultella planticola]
MTFVRPDRVIIPLVYHCRSAEFFHREHHDSPYPHTKFQIGQDIELELGALNIVFGPNGCGKSNIYKAIHLLTASADGKFSSYISEEGGLENVMWSGRTAATARHPRRLQISCLTAEFDYELQVGFPEKLPYPTQFMLDPIVKEESIWLAGFSRRPSARVFAAAKTRPRSCSMSTARKIPSPTRFMKTSRSLASWASRTASRKFLAFGKLCASGASTTNLTSADIRRCGIRR